MAAVVGYMQLGLGLWQILNFTPVGVLIQSGIRSLLLPLFRLLQPLGVSPTIARLQHFQGCIFKRVRCHEIRESEPLTLPRRLDDQLYRMESSYLGKTFVLERKEGNMLFVNEKMSYYITDAISASLRDMVKKSPKTVFLKNHKELWEGAIIGHVMTLEEVLDSLIVENHTMHALYNDWLFPVDYVESEETVETILNLLGIFLQNSFGYLPEMLSLTSALLGLSETVKKWLYLRMHTVFCCAMHTIIHKLPYSMRRKVYFFWSFVKNLKPSNDINLRVVRSPIISGVIAGGTKVFKEGATLVTDSFVVVHEYSDEELVVENNFTIGHIDLKCRFVEGKDEYSIQATTDGVDVISLDIKYTTSDELIKMLAFLACLEKNRSGTLKSCYMSCGCNNKVQVLVRGLGESIMCFVRNGYPPLYKLQLENAVVN